MSLQTSLRYAKGYVCFEVICPDPECFMNEIISQSLHVWNLRKRRSTFTGQVLATDYKHLATLARKHHCRMKLTKKAGLPFTLDKYHRRMGVYVGIAVFILILTLLPNFIWQIDIVGNQTISAQTIRTALANEGVHEGVFFPTIKLAAIQKKLVIKIPDIAFLALNRNGSKLTVDVREMQYPPAIIPDDKPCNLVAAKTGQIIRIETYAGRKQVHVMDVVKQGDILISGVADYDNSDSRLIHADGKVFAQTSTKKDFRINSEETYRVYADQFIQRKALNLFGISIPLSIPHRITGSYEQTRQSQPLCLGRIELPIAITTDTMTPYTLAHRRLSKAQMKTRLEQLMAAYEAVTFKDAEIVDKTISEQFSTDCYTLSVEYLCEENIAYRVPIS